MAAPTALAKDKRRSLEHEVAFGKTIVAFAMLSLVLVACSFVFGSCVTKAWAIAL